MKLHPNGIELCILCVFLKCNHSHCSYYNSMPQSLCDRLTSVLSVITPDIQLRIDRRNSLADLKKTLEQPVGQTSDNFKVLIMS